MSKTEWKVTDYGMEYGGYVLSSVTVGQAYNGIYGAIRHVLTKGWRDHDEGQFVSSWRRAMERHGYRINKGTFERTIRRIADERAERFVTGIYTRLDDERHDPAAVQRPWRLTPVSKLLEQKQRIEPQVRRLLKMPMHSGDDLLRRI